MTDHSTDEIRDLLARAMSDAPEPHSWSNVEDRARQHDAAPPQGRTGVWLAAAACAIALMGGLVAVIGSDDEPKVRIDAPDSTTPSTSTVPSTSAPAPSPPPTSTTTAPAPAPSAEAGWTGGLLDDIDGNSLRPLESLAEGDVVVPTAPSGWRLADAAWTGPDDAVAPDFVEWSTEVIEALPDHNAFGHILYLTQSREPICRTTLGCTPSGDSVTINGVVWESIVVERIPEDDPEFFDETTLRARIGDRWVSLGAGAPQALTGVLLKNPPIIEFLEGLRVGPPDDLAAIGEACWQCDVAGAEGDPFAVGGPDAPRTTTLDGEPTEASEPPVQVPNNADFDTGRPLTELVEGDVVVATYIPPDLIPDGEAMLRELPDARSVFEFTLATADEANSVRVTLGHRSGSVSTHNPAELDDPNHPPVEIQGLIWAWNDFAVARIAYVDSFSIDLGLHGLDRSEAERFIEGLRAVPFEQFAGPVTIDGADGLEVIADPSNTNGAQIVATDDEFELTAVRVLDQVCTKLEQTTDPVTMTFAANCWGSTSLADPGIVDLFSLEITATLHLIIGVFDSPDATAVRITSPDGNSVVAPTGPDNRAIDGRFFLARLDLDVADGIRLDHFTIEDASP